MKKTIRISQIRIPVGNKEDPIALAMEIAGVPQSRCVSAEITRRSVDARTGRTLSTIYTVDLTLDEGTHYKKNRNIHSVELPYYNPVPSGDEPCTHPVAVIGAGPAGLFCAHLLARHGYAPMVIERGKPAGERAADVRLFHQNGQLHPSSNVAFGEGGAGTFSDGKLNTQINDKTGRSRYVLNTFVAHGAPMEICYDAKPHIGTDRLQVLLPRLRNEIIKMGGTFRFETTVTDIRIRTGKLCGLICDTEEIPVSAAVFCTGHSARDTIHMFYRRGVVLQAKPFAVGLRIEHPQQMINESQYGTRHALLPPATYKLTAQASSGRGIYSFCMCPGGQVINASSQPGHLVVNGMSASDRGGRCANSAVVAAVQPMDYGDISDPLCGIAFQETLEKRAFAQANGKIPQQLFADFQKHKISTGFADIISDTAGQAAFASVHDILPEHLNRDIIEGIHIFGKKLSGFDRPDAVLSGVESRTSSPVRILRDENCESNITGLYPCGEGAGYAGGIMSAAMDGLRCAEALMRRFQPAK